MKFNRLIFIIISVILINVLTVSAYATNIGTMEVPVRYDNSNFSTEYNLEINTSGDGTVYHGSNAIRNTSVNIGMKIGDTKTLEIVPDKYGKIKSISWNSNNGDLKNFYVLEEQSNGTTKLILNGVNIDSQLNIEFEKANTPDEIPQTGDSTPIIILVLLLLISLSTILVLIKLKSSVE